MKICYFGDADSIHVVRWCRHFVSLGHEVHLISFKKTTIDGVVTHFFDVGPIDVKGKNWKVVLKFRKIKSLLNKLKPDIFHSLYATSYGFTGALCNYHPYIITAFGSDVLISPKGNPVYKTLLRYAFEKADWITVLAEHMQSKIEDLADVHKKISIVAFGIDPTVFNAKNRNIPKNEFVIVSTRALEPIYNIPHLINSVALAAIQVPNIRLQITGSGSLEADLKKLVKEKGLEKVTTFYGQVPANDLAKMLTNSSLFISVSYSDGNNISLNEAMACGTLCIASDIAANRQWIDDGQNGFLVKLDDVNGLANAIVEVYKNYEAFTQKFVETNIKIVEDKANWPNNMKKVEDKYKELLGNQDK